ncbi:unnamed protein product [Trichobilharzia regenti]|nr:unnamed protein product [Trichobilharzia regenti]
MESDGPVLLQFYGEVKLHKLDIPLQPIVSLPGTPIHDLSAKSLGKSKIFSRIIRLFYRFSSHIFGKIKNIQVDDNEIMIFFDVTALCTLMGSKQAKELIQQLLYSDEHKKSQCSAQMELIELCFTKCF